MNALGDWAQSDDFELMRGIHQRDEAALRCLIDRYSPILVAFCHRMLSDRSAAEDAASELFIELWQKSARYDSSRGQPRTYIFLLARSRCLDRLRKSSKDSTPNNTLIDELISTDHLPPDRVELSEAHRIVRESLDQLTESQQDSIELAFFEGLSHREIALRMDMPLGTVKTHIRQGLSRLRFLLKSMLDAGE